MNESLIRLHARMACLGPVSRFRLALQLLAGERCVTELAAALALSQSCTTRHLQTMAREGLVRGERAGKKVLFRLEPDTLGLIALIASARLAPGVLQGAGKARAVRPSGAIKAEAADRKQKGRRAPAERALRATPESGTPTLPAVSLRPTRSGELEDYLL